MSSSSNFSTQGTTSASEIIGNASGTKRRAEGDAGGTMRGEESDAKRHAGGVGDGFVKPTPSYEDGDFGSSDEDGLPDVPKPSVRKAKPGYPETMFETTFRHVLRQKETIEKLTQRVDDLENQLAFERKAHGEEVGRLNGVIQHISSLLKCDNCGEMCPLLWLECESRRVYCKACFDKAPPAGEVSRIRKFTLLGQVIDILDDAQ